VKSIDPGIAKECILAKVSDVKMNTRKILLKFCERKAKNIHDKLFSLKLRDSLLNKRNIQIIYCYKSLKIR
jgi:hypothetical protein